MFTCLKVKRHEDEEEADQKFFIKNGGVLLEEVIALCNGRSNPIRHFSAKELMRATNDYDAPRNFVADFDYELYKGSLKDRPILVKKYNSNFPAVQPYKDIAIGSQMSIHKNVLKVLGCCLETKIPVIVYEFAGTRNLSVCISATNDEPLPLKCRLKIAIGIASAVAYLHTAFSTPIIHRNIKCSNIILDQNNVPKLIHFGLCISIPKGETHVIDDLAARESCIAPEIRDTGYLTEKVDVYMFGLLLIQLLSGRTASYFIKRNGITDCGEHSVETFNNAIDSRIKNEGFDLKQLRHYTTLFFRCISSDEAKRPTMIEVAKELKRIDQLVSLTPFGHTISQ